MELLCRAKTSHKCQWENHVHNTEQGKLLKKGADLAESESSSQSILKPEVRTCIFV